MPPRSNAFQDLVTLIQRAMAGTGVSVESSAMIPELGTGKPREVDVLVKGTLSGFPVTFALECRDHKKPQDITWIDELVGKYEHLTQVDKVIAVSSSGFTGAAKAKAVSMGMETLTIEEARGVDWPDYLAGFKTITFENFILPELTGAKAILGSPTPVETTSEERRQCRVINAKNEDVGGLGDFAKDLLKLPRVVNELRERAPQDSGSTFKARMTYKPPRFSFRFPDGKKFPVLEVLLEGRCWKSTAVISLRQLLHGSTPVAHGTASVLGHQIDIVVSPTDQGTKQLRVALQVKKLGKARAPNAEANQPAEQDEGQGEPC